MAPKIELETISQKIKKLLALADGNQNEHERDAAMKLALELLSKHNLDIDSIARDSSEIVVCELEVFLKLDPWIRYILQAACKLYYTRFYMRPVYRGLYAERKEWHPTFVGTQENIEVTLDLAAWLINSIRLESNWLFSEQFKRRSFRLGAAHILFDRANSLIENEQSAAGKSGENSLVVLRNKLEAANSKHMEKMQLGKFKARANYLDKSAYGMGESYGSSVNLGFKGAANKSLKAITMT